MGIREEADALADEEPGRVSHLGQKVLIRRAYLAGAKRVLEMVDEYAREWSGDLTVKGKFSGLDYTEVSCLEMRVLKPFLEALLREVEE